MGEQAASICSIVPTARRYREKHGNESVIDCFVFDDPAFLMMNGQTYE